MEEFPLVPAISGLRQSCFVVFRIIAITQTELLNSFDLLNLGRLLFLDLEQAMQHFPPENPGL